MQTGMAMGEGSAGFLARYGDLADRLPGNGLPWVARLRADALARFEAEGLPGPRTEAWRYTNLNALKKVSFDLAAPGDGPSLDSVPGGALALQGAVRIVLVNGRLRPELSDLDRLPKGVEAGSLADWLGHRANRLEGRLGAMPSLERQPLAALNTAFFGDGLVLRVAPGTLVEAPIHLVSVAAADRPLVFHPRHLIEVGEGAVVTLAESHVGVAGAETFANAVSEIRVGAKARLAHLRLQAEPESAFAVGLADVEVASGGGYDSFVLALGGRLARHEIRVRLTGERAECALDGAYLVDRDQHVDNTTLIEHSAPDGRSREVYKGVLDGKSRAVFQGKIHVHPGAQKTDGHQLNRALLLSRQAEIDSKPELEIYADDVKCSHGATVGEIDADQLFFLRARGIPRDEARRMLVEAFLVEALEAIGQDGPRAAFAEALGRKLGRL